MAAERSIGGKGTTTNDLRTADASRSCKKAQLRPSQPEIRASPCQIVQLFSLFSANSVTARLELKQNPRSLCSDTPKNCDIKRNDDLSKALGKGTVFS